MKDLTTFINEVSANLARKAASRQRQKLDDDEYLNGKTALEYKKLLKRANKFDDYADKKELEEKKRRFINSTSGTLIYDRNNIQVVIRGEFEYEAYYNCHNPEEVEWDEYYQEGSFIKSDLFNEHPSNQEIKQELGGGYELDEDEYLKTADVTYPELNFYYKYNSNNPLITIEDVELDGFKCTSGPGGYSYYSSGCFGGKLNWGNVDIQEDTDDLRKNLKEVLGDALAYIISYPFGFEYVTYGDRSFDYIDADDLLEEMTEEEGW